MWLNCWMSGVTEVECAPHAAAARAVIGPSGIPHVIVLDPSMPDIIRPSFPLYHQQPFPPLPYLESLIYDSVSSISPHSRNRKRRVRSYIAPPTAIATRLASFPRLKTAIIAFAPAAANTPRLNHKNHYRFFLFFSPPSALLQHL